MKLIIPTKYPTMYLTEWKFWIQLSLNLLKALQNLDT